jgi:hypothetical protein
MYMKPLRYTITTLTFVIFYILYLTIVSKIALASPISSFNQTITAGTLTVDIVNGSYGSVTAPAVNLGTTSFSFACHNTTGALGTASEQIYVQNPDSADNGWTVSLAGSATTAVYTSAGTPFDFNDPTGSGCTDGGDADAVGGQMTVDPSGATLAKGACATCTTGNISRGSVNSFSQSSVDSITILTGAAGSDDIGDWTLRGVSISQTIPGEQPAAADYTINMTLSIVAS